MRLTPRFSISILGEMKIFFSAVFLSLIILCAPLIGDASAEKTVTVKAVTDSTVRLSWESTPHTQKYFIKAVKDATGKVTKYHTTQTKKTIDGLVDAESYTFHILPRQNGAYQKNVYTTAQVTTKLQFTASGPLLADDFEQTTNNAIFNYPDNVEYVTGHTGYGIRDVYEQQEDGSQVRANIFYYDNTDSRLMNTDTGTITLWASPSADYNDGAMHSVLDTWTNGRYHNWNISMYYTTSGTAMLSVYRDYEQCLRYLISYPITFETDEWYKLTLTWRGAETRFYINDEEVGEFEADTRTVVGGSSAEGRVNLGDDIFITDDLMITDESPIPVRDKAISLDELVDVACPAFADLIAPDTTQETYDNIDLHNFPDADTRDAMKELIDILPDSFAGEAEHVALVDDDDYNAWMSPTVNGNFPLFYHTVFLRESLFDTPEKVRDNAQIVFHEFGHGHIYAEGLNYGGPQGSDKRKEWISISGASAYVGECSNPTEILLDRGFLTAYGSTMADEDLAEWVGITLNLYRTGSTFSDLLNPESEKYSPLYEEKLDFLQEYGFLTDEMYTNISATTENTEYYTDFND